MKIHSIKFFLFFGFLFFISTMLATGKVLAKGSEIKFHSEVVAVEETSENEGVVTILVKGMTVGVRVNAHTEVVEGGTEIGLSSLAVGSFVKVEAFFSDAGGLYAEEIKVESPPEESFRFKGALTQVVPDAVLPPGLEFDSIPSMTTTVGMVTLLGNDVFIHDDTKISGKGHRGNSLSVSELALGEVVDIHGIYEQDTLLATHIKIGKPEGGDIEVDGMISELTSDGFLLDIKKGGLVNVLIDEATEVEGEPVAGSRVKVEGMLTESLSILADEIKVGNGGGD
jgi:hypothetical protein